MNALDAGYVQMTEREAEVITEQIVGRLDQVSENIEAVQSLMRDALNRRAHLALGYDSPGAYMRDRFEGALANLSAALRREIVHELSDAGMSTRAIAPIVGVDNATVHRDLGRVADATPEPEGSRPDAPEYGDYFDSPEAVAFDAETVAMLDPDAPSFSINEATGEITETPTVTEHTVTEKIRTITGLDGKTYTAPAQKKPNRRPLADQARDAGWDLRKAVEKIERLRADDRFTRNKNEVTPQLRSHLIYAIETCQGLLDGLTERDQ